MYNYERGREAQPPLLMSLKEAAQALSLSERTIWTLVHTGELPHVRVGRRLLFSRAALQSWIERQESTGDPNSRAAG
jgi:excisionase family DNA binding protein